MSHHTAPLELREKLAAPPDTVPRLLEALRAKGLGDEAVLLSTCNRVELYAVPGVSGDPDVLARWLAESRGLRARSVDPHMYRYKEREALHHLFRVASSLDSMIVGEPQILGQVKRAYRMSVEHQAAGPLLRRVMDRALTVAKRVRTETDIGRDAVSVGRSGVELARQVLGELKGRSALMIGAGAHGKVVARALIDFGLAELVVANRTFERAVELAQRYGGSAVHFDEIPLYLKRVDIVLTSTAAGRIIIRKRDLGPVMTQRRYRPLVMIDISVPRNIEPDVHELDGVFRFDIDDLVMVADKGKERRQAAAAQAEKIVGEEVERCWRHVVGDHVRQYIGNVVHGAEMIRAEELERSRAVLNKLDSTDRASIDAMTRAIVKKLLHQPLSRARDLAETGQWTRMEAIFDALGTEPESTDEGE